MYVCLCAGVTTKQITQSVNSGCVDLDSVSKKLGVGLNCGSCIYLVSQLIEKNDIGLSVQEDLNSSVINDVEKRKTSSHR